jgi:hypothetical protein
MTVMQSSSIEMFLLQMQTKDSWLSGRLYKSAVTLRQTGEVES